VALEALYREVGFARGLLAYELPDGRLKLLDGPLRRDLDPDMEVEVEVLDLTDEEARALLLSIDPLAALAQTQEELHERLQELTPVKSEDLRAARPGAGVPGPAVVASTWRPDVGPGKERRTAPPAFGLTAVRPFR
jgi:hypothetical protein